jgi:UTP--glucose-1-phosphate uridylyltransferase
MDQSAPRPRTEESALNVKKAVITAAGRSQRVLPLQTFVDRDGVEKTSLQIVVEEVLSAGVEEVGVVVVPGDQEPYAAAAGPYAARLQFVEQTEPRGYGHALGLARGFLGREPFLHLVSDHLYVSRQPLRCAGQVVQCAREESCAVSAVQATREAMLPFYGTVGGRRVPRRPRLYEIDNVLEKPTPSEAEQHLLVPGLRAGHYLCLFGIHVFTPAVLDLLDEAAEGAAPDQPVQLAPVLARLAARERYLALEVQGRRYNIGLKYGLLTAQLALALDGNDRDYVLTQLIELLAQRAQTTT